MRKLAENIEESEALRTVAGLLKKIRKDGAKIISVLGAEGAGSSTLARKLADELCDADCISTDDCLIGDRAWRRKNLEGKDPLLKYDQAFLKKEIEAICNLKQGQHVRVSDYDEATGIAKDAGYENFKRKVGKVEYLIIEGAVHFIVNADYLIYFDVPDHVRLYHRIKRGLEKRNEESEEKIIENFNVRQGIEYRAHIQPSIKKADMLLKAEASRKKDGFIYRYSIYLKKNKTKQLIS